MYVPPALLLSYRVWLAYDDDDDDEMMFVETFGFLFFSV